MEMTSVSVYDITQAEVLLFLATTMEFNIIVSVKHIGKLLWLKVYYLLISCIEGFVWSWCIIILIFNKLGNQSNIIHL